MFTRLWVHACASVCVRTRARARVCVCVRAHACMRAYLHAGLFVQISIPSRWSNAKGRRSLRSYAGNVRLATRSGMSPPSSTGKSPRRSQSSSRSEVTANVLLSLSLSLSLSLKPNADNVGNLLVFEASKIVRLLLLMVMMMTTTITTTDKDFDDGDPDVHGKWSQFLCEP